MNTILVSIDCKTGALRRYFRVTGENLQLSHQAFPENPTDLDYGRELVENFRRVPDDAFLVRAA